VRIQVKRKDMERREDLGGRVTQGKNEDMGKKG